MMPRLTILFLAITIAATAQKETAVDPTSVHNIGGFAGNRIEKNKNNYLKTFDIAKYVGLMETRDFTGWDWRQGEQPGKWREAAVLYGEPSAHAIYQRILKSQASDGYIGITSQSVRTPEKPLGGM